MRRNLLKITALMLSMVMLLSVFSGCDLLDGLLSSDGENTDVSNNKTQCEHVWGEPEVMCEATCISMGSSKRVCSECGYMEYIFHDALGHDWNEGVVIGYAQDDSEIIYYSCKNCEIGNQKLVKDGSTGLLYGLINEDTEYSVNGIGECTDTEITVPKRFHGLPVTEIGEKAFYECNSIISIKLPDSIKKICEKAFSKCEALESVSMPDNVEIGLDVFRGSINVEINSRHNIAFVEAKPATCYEPGNIAHYKCLDCADMYFSDEEGQNRIYDVIIPNEHKFEDGMCSECGSVQEEVTITSVDVIPFLGKFALGTLENAIGLPMNIHVWTADGMEHTLGIVWNMADYDKSTVGTYTITGHIQADELYFAEGLTNQISATVEIVEYMQGTADIVFVLDISGSMSDEVDHIKNNLQSFAQAIDEKGVSARWSVITYSDFEDCPGIPEEETQCVMNGASSWYTDVHACKNAIDSIVLANGGDTPEVAVDGLMMADSLEKRRDARVFYVLLTDATYKVDNHYGVSSLNEATEIIASNGANVSVITDTSLYSTYGILTESTNGLIANIYSNFSQTMLDTLVPIIYEDVIS